MRVLLLAAVLLAGCDDILSPDGGLWRFNQSTDEISGQPYAHASLDGNLGSGMTLYVRCRHARFDVYITTDFVTHTGDVRFRIDDGAHRVETWNEATDFQGVFYRGDARAFARELARSDEMIFEAREFLGDPHQATFELPGLDAHLPKVEAACA